MTNNPSTTVTSRAHQRSARRRAWVLLLVGAMVATASATSTFAMRHLRLVKSFPSKDTVLATSPDAVRLWLSEPTQVPVSKVSITAADGKPVATSPLTRAADKDAPLTATLTKPVADGKYTVTWKTMSKDGHVVNGTFGFAVRAAAK